MLYKSRSGTTSYGVASIDRNRFAVSNRLHSMPINTSTPARRAVEVGLNPPPHFGGDNDLFGLSPATLSLLIFRREVSANVSFCVVC